MNLINPVGIVTEERLPRLEAKDIPDDWKVPKNLPPLASKESVKYDDAKLAWNLLPMDSVEDVVRILNFGAKKYDAHNWRKTGFNWTRIFNSCMRHLMAWIRGEDNDPESGLNHLAHAACNLLFLLEFTRTHPELDDRYATRDRNKKPL